MEDHTTGPVTVRTCVNGGIDLLASGCLEDGDLADAPHF